MTPVYTGSVSHGVKRKSNTFTIKDTIELDFSLDFSFSFIKKDVLVGREH